MSKLLLVRHSEPEIHPELPPSEWPLSEEGRRRCAWLAEEMRLNLVSRVFCSEELKARQTAELIAPLLETEAAAWPGLQENDRTGFGFTTPEALKKRLAMFFTRPTRVVLGQETAEQAQARFTAALNGLLEEAPGETVAVVAHGAVISLMAAAGSKARAFDVWERLALPSYIVLERETFAFGGAIRNYAA